MSTIREGDTVRFIPQALAQGAPTGEHVVEAVHRYLVTLAGGIWNVMALEKVENSALEARITELEQQLDAAKTTIAEVKEWRLWAHEQYDIHITGTVTSNRLKKILGIEDYAPKASLEQVAYRKRIMELFNQPTEEHAEIHRAPPYGFHPRCTATSYWPGESEPTLCGRTRGHKGDHETYPAGRGWSRKEQS